MAIKVFCPVREMSEVCGKSKESLNELRVKGILHEGIHWISDPSSARILWNQPLVLDWLVNGFSDGHQRACEAFVASLASSKAA